MNLLMSVAATEGEFLLISGKSYCLYSSAQRDEMSEEREREIKREVEQKRTTRRKSAVEQVQERKRE